MKKLDNKSEHFNNEKFPQAMRAQPRKFQHHTQKNAQAHAHHSDDENERHHGHHHHEPAKNAVRMQLRNIQRLF
jgi:hypothetical protein